MSHLSNVWFKVTDLAGGVTAEGAGSPPSTARSTSTSPPGSPSTRPATAIRRWPRAIAEQAERFIHAQVNVFTHDLLEPLAAKLAELAPAAIDTFFFANSGAEITEAAVKLAKQVTKRPNTIVFSGSFHGRTHMAMAMTTSKTGVPRRSRTAAGRRVRGAVPRPARRRPGRRGRRGAHRLRPPAAQPRRRPTRRRR